jgi:sphinganine-1-phosphate aldolase
MDSVEKVIPKHGIAREALLEQMKALRGNDVPWEQNRVFSLVYHHTAEHTDLLKAAYNLFFSENGLNPMAFKSLQTMEHDVVRMTARMLHGGEEVTGSMTSGGTESLLLAVWTYRERARKQKPWIRHPEIILPESAHVAFIKAGEYFNVKMVRTPLRGDFRADVDAIEKRINRNTIALVGSAPCYPYGVVDPIEEIAALAQQRGLGMHVDACVGGFFLPWAERLGYAVPPFDFRVAGVTSISADIHKYGYAAKGASTVLYRDMDLFRHQLFAYVDWCGGVYASATIPGTRPGGAIAAAWAALHALGEDGYLANAKSVMDTARRFMDGINAIPELAVLGDPAMCIFAYSARAGRLSGYAVADRLERKGWHIDRLQKPESIHVMLNPGHAHVADKYLADLREAVDYVKQHPDAAFEGSAPMYGLVAKAPMRRMVKKNVLALFEQMYSARGAPPDLGSAPAADGDPEEPAPAQGVPKPVLQLMKLKARIERLFQGRTKSE